MGEVVRFHLDGESIEVCKASLAKHATVFAPLADETGPSDYGSSELQCLLSPLCLRAKEVVPLLLRWFAAQADDDDIFSEQLLLHTFAAAHLLGATELMEAARRKAASHDGRPLIGAVAALNLQEDVESLRTCAEYGLDRYSCMAIVHAAAEGDMGDVVRILVSLEDGEQPKEPSSVECTVDLLDAKGRTALHVCAIRDSAQAAKVLLEFSASLTALCDPPEVVEDDTHEEVLPGTPAAPKGPKSKGLRTPLHLAAYHDSVEVLQLLLDARANVASCVKGVQGALTPLHECATSDAVRCAAVLAPLAREAASAGLAQLEAAVNAMEVDGEDSVAPEPPDVNEVQWSRFLDPLQAKLGHHGSTPLHLAAESDSGGVCSALLGCGADPQLGDDQGDTALHCAVLYGSPKALQALLEGGAAVSENCNGELPLHLMAEFGPGGDDCDLPPHLEKRHFARSMRAQELLLEALSQKGLLTAALKHKAAGDMQNTPLHAVVRNDHMGAQHAVQLLVKVQADLEAQNEEGRTPLSLALRRHGRSGKVCQLLRQLGAKEPPALAGDDLAGALGGYLRPLMPSTSNEMEVDGVQLPIESQ